MRINSTYSEKKNLIEQLKEDVLASGLQLEIPSDESKIEFTNLTKIDGVDDTGTDDEVKNNTRVTVNITTDDGVVTKTFEFRRLDYNHIKTHAGLVDNKGYSVQAHFHEDTSTPEDKVLEKMVKEKLGLVVEKTPSQSNLDSNLISGIDRYRFQASNDSLLYAGEVSLNVQVRAGNTGMYVANGKKEYFTNSSPMTAATTEQVYLPFEETEVPENKFKGFTIGKVVIPDSYTIIGDGAFEDALTSLEKVTFGSKVASIGENAFKGCVTPVFRLPDSITYLESSSLGRVEKFELDTLNKVELIVSTDAGGSDAVVEYTVNHVAGNADTDRNTYSYVKVGTSKVFFTKQELTTDAKEVFSNADFGKKVKELVLSKDVDVIDGQFKNINVDNIDLSTVTSVNANSFENATIKNLYIPSTLVGLDTNAFKDATIENIHVETELERDRVKAAVPSIASVNYIVKATTQPAEVIKSNGFTYA